jgi:hypothetical protein
MTFWAPSLISIPESLRMMLLLLQAQEERPGFSKWVPSDFSFRPEWRSLILELVGKLQDMTDKPFSFSSKVTSVKGSDWPHRFEFKYTSLHDIEERAEMRAKLEALLSDMLSLPQGRKYIPDKDFRGWGRIPNFLKGCVAQSATQLERVFHEEPERVDRRRAAGHNVPPVSLPSSSFTSPLATPRFKSADDILDAALHSAGSKEEKLAAVERAMQEVRELLQKDADAAKLAAQVAEERQRRETEAAEQRAAAIREMLSAPEPTEPPTAEEPAEGEEYLADLMRGVGTRRAERKKARAEERKQQERERREQKKKAKEERARKRREEKAAREKAAKEKEAADAAAAEQKAKEAADQAAKEAADAAAAEAERKAAEAAAAEAAKKAADAAAAEAAKKAADAAAAEAAKKAADAAAAEAAKKAADAAAAEAAKKAADAAAAGGDGGDEGDDDEEEPLFNLSFKRKRTEGDSGVPLSKEAADAAAKKAAEEQEKRDRELAEQFQAEEERKRKRVTRSGRGK